MPAEALIAAGAQGLSSMITQGLNAGSQIVNNRASRKWQEKMYARQRLDALADYNMQNEYNSPQAQMARLKAAGLNPNLVYGNGNAVQSAGAVRSAEAGSWRPEAPQFDMGGAVGSALGAYYDTRTKQAQLDNLAAQNSVFNQEALLKAAQVLQTTATTDLTKTSEAEKRFDLGLKNSLREYSIEAARSAIEKTKADTEMTLSSNERAKAMQAPNLQLAIERILTERANRETSAAQRQMIRAQIHNIENDSRLKELDINLKKQGIQPGDPIWMRILGQNLQNLTMPTVKPGDNHTWRGMQYMFPLLRGFK